MTERLAPHCRELRAYEIDRRLVPVLRTGFSGTAQVRVVGGDFIAARPPHALFSVAGNVPVSRTAALVERGFSGVGDSLHASLRRAHPRRRVDAAFRAAGLLGPPGAGRGRWRRGGG